MLFMSKLKFIEVIESSTGRSISIFIDNVLYFKPIVESREIEDKNKISLLCFENVVVGTEIVLKNDKVINSDTEYGFFKEMLLEIL
tara:strand:- start:2884 stop:3141 length:258 start_codon:yes stop_codon:yes gene_type:complete